MRNSLRRMLVVAAVVGFAGSASAFWFMRDMYDMPSVKPQEGQPRDLPAEALPTSGKFLPTDLPFHKRQAELDPKIPEENPVTASEASLARGKELYERQCIVCHGPNGMGQGPVAQRAGAIPPMPLAGVAGRTDRYVYAQIWGGGPTMGKYWMAFEREEVWDVVNYVRSLVQQ